MSDLCEKYTFRAMGRGYCLYSLYTQPSINEDSSFYTLSKLVWNLTGHIQSAYIRVRCIHIPKVDRKKLDSKSISCLLVGYCTIQKAYRFWDTIARRTRISLLAIFNEQISIAPRDGMTPKEDKHTEKQLFDLIASEPENEMLNAGNDVIPWSL
jgi:hypothetical protein